MVIDLQDFSLRPWRKGDEISLARFANNPKIWQNVRDAFPCPYTLQDAREWIEAVAPAQPPNQFAIEIDGQASGGIGLVLQTDVHRRSAEIGYWLAEPFWNRGIITRAVQAVTEYGFATFDICRIFAGVYSWNAASMRVLEKAGYEFEGRHRRSVTKGDQIGDYIVYATVRD